MDFRITLRFSQHGLYHYKNRICIYEVRLLNNETARLEGALEGWRNKRVVRWVAANLLYSRTKTRFRHYFSMCAAAV